MITSLFFSLILNITWKLIMRSNLLASEKASLQSDLLGSRGSVLRFGPMVSEKSNLRDAPHVATDYSSNLSQTPVSAYRNRKHDFATSHGMTGRKTGLFTGGRLLDAPLREGYPSQKQWFCDQAWHDWSQNVCCAVRSS